MRRAFFGGTSTPNEYTLLRFDVKKGLAGDHHRSFNAYGASGGTDDKAMVAFTYTKLRPGAYKVTLNAPLMTGEYGFVRPAGLPVDLHDWSQRNKPRVRLWRELGFLSLKQAVIGLILKASGGP